MLLCFVFVSFVGFFGFVFVCGFCFVFTYSHLLKIKQFSDQRQRLSCLRTKKVEFRV